MTEEEANALLGGTTSQAQPTGFSERVGQAAPVPDFVTDPFGQAGAVVREPERADFIRRNKLPGIPLDLDQEVSPWLKFRTATLPTTEDKLRYLNTELRAANPDFYGATMPARPSDTGEILVRVPDAQGKPIEIPVNAPGFSGSDLATVAAHAPATAAALAAALYTKKLPLGEKAPRTMASLYSTTAAAGTGALEDIIARGTAGQEAQVGEAAGRRALEIPVGLAIDAGAMGLLGLGRRILSPFATVRPGEVGADLREGVKYYKDEFGMEFPVTVGEITQSPLALRTEATLGRQPGGSATLEAAKKEKTAFFEEAQEKIIGAERSAIPTEEVIGQRAVSAIKGKIEPIQSSIKSQREALFDALSTRVEQTMDEVTGEARQVFTERVGAGVRAKAVSMWQSLQENAAQKYEALYAMPGGSERILQAPKAAEAAEKALSSLPGYTKGAEQATFETVLPPKAISVLQELADTKGAQMSLRDLIGARSALDDVIAKERGGLPDIKLRELNNARGLFTKAIEEAAESSPDKAMARTWKDINKWYAGEAKKFDPTAVQKLFVKSDKPGHILDEDIVKNLKSSEYLEFKEFLGASSSEFKTLKRSVVDQMMAGARMPGGRIDGQKFLDDLFKLREDKRAIFDDILPAAVEERARQLGQSLVDLGAKEPVKAIREALTSGEPAMIRRLRQLEVTENKLAAKYRSDILKQIGEGKLDPASFDAGKFVDLVYSNSNVGPEQMAKVMAELSDTPEVQQLLKQKVVEKLFYDAQRLVKGVDPSRLGKGEVLRPANTTALERAFGGEENRKKMEVILGSRTMADIAQLGKLLRSSEISEEAFASAGNLSSGMFVAGMIQHPMSYPVDWLKQKFAAILITSPVLKKYVQNLAVQKTPFRQAFSDEAALTIIGSVPFQQALVREYGVSGAKEVTQAYLRGVEQKSQDNPSAETPAQREQRIEQLLGERP